MLSTLWHDPLVSSNNKKNKVYPACTCKHIFNESFVAGDIYNSDSKTVRIIEICKPEVNSDAPLFLFLQSVRVYTSQCLYKGTFAMVNMSCGSEDYIAHLPALRISFLLPSLWINVTVGFKKIKSWWKGALTFPPNELLSPMAI